MLGLHPAGAPGGHPSSGTGWGTYYMQEHYTFGTSISGNVVSLITEGVFERFPNLKVALIESGFSWAPSLGWRMDKQWAHMRKETPHLKRPPSDYWIGWDRMMFSSDYPHWDFDDPRQALSFKMTEAQRAGILRDNARALYRLE